MNQTKLGITALALSLTILSCTSYNAFQKAKTAETSKDWDQAVIEYQKAIDVDPNNKLYQINLTRAKLESSRVHFQKGKALRDSAQKSRGSDQIRLLKLAADELELVVRLDPTNQFAEVEYGKAVNSLQDLARTGQPPTIDELKKRAKANISKSQPPQLSPSSDQPISLSFPKETPIKEIYKALGNAFGINILFDQAVKDDRVAIELKDVTAQQALERVMQAANHFYKALDEHTIIVVPDNPQARRDYEDLVIRTFYLSNGDAEQVTNVVRTMIEARNVFPLKALNAITIRDTADKVRIAEKIIEANDKAKAEVVVDVELLQVDLDKTHDIGAVVAGLAGSLAAANVPTATDTTGTVTFLPGNLNTIRGIRSSNLNFTIPTVSYSLVKSVGNTETLANPELRISEGEKATLHIGQRVPVPVTTFTTGVQSGSLGSLPATSFQYQDVGIKVSIEPRVHHNNEVTLKLTVEVSDVGSSVSADAPPSFNTRTIEATIRLKDGETNFLAGLIQDTNTNTNQKTPFLGDIPILGRLFSRDQTTHRRTDLMLTMTPHIIRMPDITEDDLAPMWVGTQSNLSFRGLSPRIESQSTVDPFSPRSTQQFNAGAVDGDGNPIPANVVVPPGTGPTDPFRGRTPPLRPATPNGQAPPQNPQPNPQPQSELITTPGGAVVVAQSVAAGDSTADNGGLAPRIQPQPMRLSFKPGEEKLWSVVGMDLDGLTTKQLLLHYDPHTLAVSEVVFGPAMVVDPRTPPVATIDAEHGTVRITSSNGKPLQFNNGGGDIASLRVRGGASGDTYLVLENPNLTNGNGTLVNASVSGGHAKVD